MPAAGYAQASAVDSSVDNSIMVGEPRTYGVSATYRF
jgi:hypothetical protein